MTHELQRPVWSKVTAPTVGARTPLEAVGRGPEEHTHTHTPGMVHFVVFVCGSTPSSTTDVISLNT